MRRVSTRVARWCLLAIVAALLVPTVTSPEAEAIPGKAQTLKYEVGPLRIDPGQNIIQFTGGDVPKPTEPGWIVGIRPNLHLASGEIPRVDVIHLHHAVWLNASRSDSTIPGIPERFFAAGEEKTETRLPFPYGYRFDPNDTWIINYMIHNLVVDEFEVYIDYEIDFVPQALGEKLGYRDARPLWLDVVNGSIYPVFDVHKDSGTDGLFTYPDDDPSAPRRNSWTVDRDGVLIGAGGHLHPGGIHTELFVDRTMKSGTERTKRLFKSKARYWEPAGPVSWDVAMTVTRQDYRVKLRAGDKLRMTATYETTRAWYESMGIMVLWYADGAPGGANPFRTKVDKPGRITHGPLEENRNHGGEPTDLADPRLLPNGPTMSSVDIQGFLYRQGDLSFDDDRANPPVVAAGDAITYVNRDAPSRGYGIWHTVSACKAPCNLSTGIAYPLQDADVEFDSGQLGRDGEPTAGRLSWQTPTDLDPGTYTFFCRVHPFMRGAFRVAPGAT